MLHAGLDLSRRRLDSCLLDENGETIEAAAAAPDADGLRSLVREVEHRHGSVFEVKGAMRDVELYRQLLGRSSPL